MRGSLSLMILSCLLLGCGSGGKESAARGSATWDGEVRVDGELRAMIHAGRVGPNVDLATLLPAPDLYALGALANLAGEVTVVAGTAYLSYPDAQEKTRTETVHSTSAAATLLVSAHVPAWRSFNIEAPIRFDELDAAIATLAATAGVNTETRFPFLIEGGLEDLRWHVIDGSRLPAGATSHEDHRAAGVKSRIDRGAATLLGFYSRDDQGVFTHMGSTTHIHCVVDAPVATGHVDHVVVPAGTTIKFPARPAQPN
jgi:acetolactate decarboxylase